MNISDIHQTYDTERGSPSTPAIVLFIELGGASFEGTGLTLSLALERLLCHVKSCRDRLNGIPDGYMNEKTLYLKNALNGF